MTKQYRCCVLGDGRESNEAAWDVILEYGAEKAAIICAKKHLGYGCDGALECTVAVRDADTGDRTRWDVIAEPDLYWSAKEKS